VKSLTDSQIITALVSAQLDTGVSLKEALRIVVESKILGTYRIAAMELASPDNLLFIKNSGDFELGFNKTTSEVVVSSDHKVFEPSNLGHGF